MTVFRDDLSILTDACEYCIDLGQNKRCYWFLAVLYNPPVSQSHQRIPVNTYKRYSLQSKFLNFALECLTLHYLSA
jgi:hypothetical protein